MGEACETCRGHSQSICKIKSVWLALARRIGRRTMILSYWDCKYNDYMEIYDEEAQEENRTYGCSHPDKFGLCDADNMYDAAECPIAELDDKITKPRHS